MNIHPNAFTLKNPITMENYFAQFKKTISPEREQEIYETLSNILDMSYQEYRIAWWVWWLWLPQMFYDLWFLIRDNKPKATEIGEKLENTHWKKDKETKTEKQEKDKVAEIHINKQSYCNKIKADPDYEKLVKIKEFHTLDDSFFVVWITRINNEWKTVCWWTTMISRNETPKIYEDIYTNYKRYYDAI